MRRRSVLLVNLMSALATVIAALVVVWIGAGMESLEPYLLAVAAGFFIYIAASDIIPTIHAEQKLRVANYQTVILLAGVVVVGLLIGASHNFAEPSHDHDSALHS